MHGFSWWCLIILSEVEEVGFVEVHDADLVLDGVHGGVVHDVLDTLLLGDLKKLAPIIGGSKFFSGGYKYELVLDIP